MILNKCEVKAPLISELEGNFQKLIQIIDQYITGKRKEQLKQLYEFLKPRMIEDPASSFVKFHNCFRGGYTTHVLNVVSCSLKINKVWTDMGSVIEHTTEELVFAALNHDLGKLGDEDNKYYVPNDSEWHVKNLGQVYNSNKELFLMSVPDRGLYMLQVYGVSVSKNEYVAIKIHDGLYAEGNKEYLLNSKPTNSLPYILHQGDLMAARIEHENQQVKTDTKEKLVQSGKHRSNKAEVLFKDTDFKLKL